MNRAQKAADARKTVSRISQNRPIPLAKPSESLFSPTILFVFMNTFAIMFQFQVCVPTIADYIEYLGVHRDFTGAFIALASWGSALIQIVVFLILSCTSYKVAVAMLVTVMGVGNILYALALPADSIALLLLGRLMMALTSGLQITMTGINRALSDPGKEFDASRLNTIIYSLGGFLAYFASAFTQETMVRSTDVVVNNYNVVGFVSAAICAVIVVFVVLKVPYNPVKKAKTRTNNSSASLYTLLLSWYMIYLFNYLEVMRQVSIFELWDKRWKHDSAINTNVGITMFAGVLFLGRLIIMVFDHYVLPKPRQQAVISALLCVSYIPLLPYDMPSTASILLQGIFGIVFGFFVQNAFSYAVYLALEYVKISRYPQLILMITSIVMNLGFGTGSTVSTLFDLSPVPASVGIVLVAIGTPLLLWS